jgi:hypothetical protein
MKPQAPREKPDIGPFGTYRAQDHAISLKKKHATINHLANQIEREGKLLHF